MTLDWNEDHSQIYSQVAKVAVPRRAEQMASLLTLLPFNRDESFRVVELASGEGRLAQAVLAAFPNATLLALDISDSMRKATSARLEQFNGRGQVAPFDMAANDWYGHLKDADVVLSSLCIHHLDAAGKQALFAAVGEHLSPRGALLIADLVEAARPQVRELYARMYHHTAREQAGEDTELFDYFEAKQWNYFQYPDAGDTPSPLFDQLRWLSQAGFSSVDCFWLYAGHAVYGGYKPGAALENTIGYDDALAVVQSALV